ncbi:hypothetical protein QF20_004502, partial [Salmonella enterica subsp. enterica]|nr:hypothetical protein [Salmonella enterica subsp. enterica serovar Mikawasima]
MNNNDPMSADDFRRLADFLPESVLHMAVVIGWEETTSLINKFGGVQISIGRGIRSNNEAWSDVLADALSPEALRAFMQTFGGDSAFIVPRCDRARREHRNRRFVYEVNNAIRRGLSTRKALASLCPLQGSSTRERRCATITPQPTQTHPGRIKTHTGRFKRV